MTEHTKILSEHLNETGCLPAEMQFYLDKYILELKKIYKDDLDKVIHGNSKMN